MRDEALKLSEVNRQALQLAIREQAIDQGGSQLASAILTALSKSRSSGEESVKSRQLVLLHDGRRNAWQKEDEVLWRTIRERLASDNALSLRVVPLEADLDRDPRQVSVNDLEYDRDTIALNTPGRFRATLKNHSNSHIRGGRFVWRIDGTEVKRDLDLSMPPQEELMVEQMLRFENPGSHLVECEFVFSDDIFSADNSVAMVVEVPAGLPILIVDDTVRTQPGQILPSEFLSASLGRILENQEPKKSGGKESLLFDAEIITSDSLGSDRLEGCLAVVIAKADLLPDGSAAMLRKFVEGGGGLWVMMETTGDDLPQWMTILLKELGLEALSKTERLIAKSADVPMKIMASDPEGKFASGMVADRLDLFRAELLVVHDLKQRAYLEQERLLETDQGSTVLLSLGVGAGKVMLQTTDLTRLNTNLPLLQCFVPFVREVIREAIQGALPRRNLKPGEPIRVPLLSQLNAAGSGMMENPDGSKSLMVKRGNWHEMAGTLQPGIYRQLSDRQDASEEVVGLFSVQRPSSESDLEPISAEETASLIQSSEVSLPEVAPEERAVGWPMAWLFAVLTGVFFLAEALLAHAIARRLATANDGVELKPVF